MSNQTTDRPIIDAWNRPVTISEQDAAEVGVRDALAESEQAPDPSGDMGRQLIGMCAIASMSVILFVLALGPA